MQGSIVFCGRILDNGGYSKECDEDIKCDVLDESSDLRRARTEAVV